MPGSYYRNAINNGILIVEMDTDGITEKDQLRVVMDESGILVSNLSSGLSVRRPGFRKELEDIILSGGLIEYVKQRQKNKKEGVICEREKSQSPESS